MGSEVTCVKLKLIYVWRVKTVFHTLNGLGGDWKSLHGMPLCHVGLKDIVRPIRIVYGLNWTFSMFRDQIEPITP